MQVITQNLFAERIQRQLEKQAITKRLKTQAGPGEVLTSKQAGQAITKAGCMLYLLGHVGRWGSHWGLRVPLPVEVGQWGWGQTSLHCTSAPSAWLTAKHSAADQWPNNV